MGFPAASSSRTSALTLSLLPYDHGRPVSFSMTRLCALRAGLPSPTFFRLLSTAIECRRLQSENIVSCNTMPPARG